MPEFDPVEAGIDASMLLLLEAPGARATIERGGSGFVSSDNDDATAANMWMALREAGVQRATDVVTWNVVPWYIGDDTTIRAAGRSDLLEARESLVELLTILRSVRVVVLIGKAAARGWERLDLATRTVVAPHPSPRNLNSRPWARAELVRALREAREVARGRS